MKKNLLQYTSLLWFFSFLIILHGKSQNFENPSPNYRIWKPVKETHQSGNKRPVFENSKKSHETNSQTDNLLSGETQRINANYMGRSSNLYSISKTYRNQVFANDSLNLVLFIHQQDVTIYGGGEAGKGFLRFDYSLNKGQSFFVDQGPINPAKTFGGHFPQISAVITPNQPVNPLRLTYFSPVIDDIIQNWAGSVAGVSDLAVSPANQTENYYFNGRAGISPGGLCPGAGNTFWSVASSKSGFPPYVAHDSLVIYKGIIQAIAPFDVQWGIHEVKPIPNNRSFDGSAYTYGENIAFSPSGQYGWIAFLGDLTGGIDSVLSPVFLKSSDAGTTWGPPVEVDLRNFPEVMDAIRFWVTIDSVTGDTLPYGSDIPTTSVECDLTVDLNGNPHLAVVVGNGYNYTFDESLSKSLIDITSVNGGITWKARLVSDIGASIGEVGTPDPNDGSMVEIHNFPQISRTEAGDYIFYSWIDADTQQVGPDLYAPDLYIAGYRLGDGYVTCNHKVAYWQPFSGDVIFPTLAPTVFGTLGTGYFNLPIVVPMMLINDQNGPVQFYYFGDDAYLNLSDFFCPEDPYYQGYTNANFGCLVCIPPLPGSCFPTSVEESEPEPIYNPKDLDQFIVYPNPGQDFVQLKGEFLNPEEINVRILDYQGRVVATSNSGFNGLSLKWENNTSSTLKMDTHKLQNGFYVCEISYNGQVETHKICILR